VKIRAIILFLFISSFFFGQGSKCDEDKILYEKGMAIIDLLHEDYYFSENLHSTNLERKKVIQETYNFIVSQALVYFNDIITNYPDSDFYVLALHEKANFEYQLENIKVAKEIFLKILNLENNKWKFTINDSLMSLAAIAIEEHEYELALQYLDKRKSNGLFYFCGVERDVTEIQIKNMYNEIQEGLKKK
jgi:tetratricopeptide (TPR) repeat protein